MLVLTRKPGEKIVIGDNIILTLLSCKGSQVRIGIEAPREVKAVRAELIERRKARGPDELAGVP